MTPIQQQAERTLWDEIGWRAIFLTRIPSFAIILIGIMIAVVGVTPHDEITVVYFGVGFAAIIGLVLTQISVPAIRHPSQRIWLCVGVVLTTVLAYATKASIYVWISGLSLVLFGLIFLGLQAWVRSSLTAQGLFAYRVRWSPAIDYAAIFAILPDGTLEKQLESIDEPMIRQNLRRFALPPQDVRQQIDVWDRIAEQAIRSLEQMNQALAQSGHGNNVHVVFDVDMGGFIYLRLHPHRFLFVATLDQRYLNDNSFDRDALQLYHDYMRRSSVQHA